MALYRSPSTAITWLGGRHNAVKCSPLHRVRHQWQRSVVESLSEMDRDPIALILPDHLPQLSFDREFVGAVP